MLTAPAVNSVTGIEPEAMLTTVGTGIKAVPILGKTILAEEPGGGGGATILMPLAGIKGLTAVPLGRTTPR
jgi:hypothetical protein